MPLIKIVIDGIAGANGEYGLDTAEPFNNREWHMIKEIAGVRMGELEDAVDAGDNDLMVAFTAIALKRADKDVPVDAIWDAKAGSVRFEIPKVADADDPPTSPTPSEQASTVVGDENKPPSVPPSESDSVSSENGLSRIGLQASELSVT